MALLEQAGSANKPDAANGSAESRRDDSQPQDSSPSVATILRKAFEARSFRIDRDEEYSRLYSLDFTLTRLRDVHAHVNLGVQVTTEGDELSLQEKFLAGCRRGITHKSIFVEVDRKTLETGAIPVAVSACMSFLFDRRYGHFKSMGLRVFEDCTFHFFDVEENVRRLKRSSADDAHRIGQEMTGNIIAYFTDKGFGFIESTDDQKFFFHIANVVDDDLRVQLPAYIPGDVLPVAFKYGGSDGKKYPKAIDVLMDHDQYDDEDDGYDDEDDDY